MSFMNSMKKAAASAVSQIMEEPGARSEPMNAELEGIEASLQAQMKELKAFVTGMNSTLNAALAAAQLYREEGGDRALAEAVRCRRPCCVVIDHPRRAQKAAPLTGAVLVRRSATPSMRWRRTW